MPPTKTPPTRLILQIMPAPGWGALLRDPGEEETFMVSLVGWALVEQQGRREVVGLTAENVVRFADEETGFEGYVEMQAMLDEGGPLSLLDDLDDAVLDDEDDDDDLPPADLPGRRSRLN